MIDSRDINELHPVVRRGAIELIEQMKKRGYAVGISSTFRDFERQNALYAQGRTTRGKVVTNAKGGQSIHNYRLAFDIFKNIRGQEWSDYRFFQMAGSIWTGMGGDWGGNWKGFVDLPHCQFTNGLSLSQLQKGFKVPENAKMEWEIKSNDQELNYRVNVRTSLNVRYDSTVNSKIVGSLQNGTIIIVTGFRNGFARITNGWVSIRYISKV